MTIGEYGRDGGGPGDADLDWYCTANSDAHHGRQPVYLSCAAELTALMGPAGYAVLVELCTEFASRNGQRLQHPADAQRPASVRSA